MEVTTMATKLTLSAEPEVIEEAKRLAAENHTSVSAMFARIIRSMARQKRPASGLGAVTRKLVGTVKLLKGKNGRDVLTEALMKKYGLNK
jgi:hypothetical protein